MDPPRRCATILARERRNDLFTQLFQYRTFIRNLVVRDLKLRYQASVLGFLWSMLNPLLMLAIYNLIFSVIMRVEMQNYTLFLFSAMMPWTFFSGSLIASTYSVVGGAGLIRSVHFPFETLPVATVLFSFTQLVLALVVVVPGLVLLTGARFTWIALLAIPLLLLQLLFTLGIALALSALTTVFRDITHFTEIVMLLLFWLTPIVYKPDMAPPYLQAWFRISPPAAFAIACQDLLVWNRLPSAKLVLMLVVGTTVALVVGRWIFGRLSTSFAERI